MTLEQIEAEIATLRRDQENQKKHWFRWGLAFDAASLLLYVAVLIRVALTGDDPPPQMLFIALTLTFVGIAFITAGRLPRLARRRQ